MRRSPTIVLVLLLTACSTGTGPASVPASSLASPSAPTSSSEPDWSAIPTINAKVTGAKAFPTGFPALLGVAPAAYGSWWVTNGSEGGEPPRVRRIDPDTLEVTAVIELGGETGVFPPDADGAALSAKGIWVGLASQQAVVLVNPKTNKVSRRIGVDATPYRVMESGDKLWISDFENSQVLRVDLNTGEEEFRLGVPDVTEMRSGPEGLWVVEHGGFVTRLNPETGEKLARVEVGGRPGLALGLGSVWAGSDDEGTLSRIDPTTNQVITTIDLPSNGKDPVIAGGSVWIVATPQRGDCERSSYLVRIDPASNAIDGLLPLPCPGIGAAEDGRLRISTTKDGVMSVRYVEMPS